MWELYSFRTLQRKPLNPFFSYSEVKYKIFYPACEKQLPIPDQILRETPEPCQT